MKKQLVKFLYIAQSPEKLPVYELDNSQRSGQKVLPDSFRGTLIFHAPHDGERKQVVHCTQVEGNQYLIDNRGESGKVRKLPNEFTATIIFQKQRTSHSTGQKVLTPGPEKEFSYKPKELEMPPKEL